MITQYSKDMERVARALHLCRKFHEGQVDKCGQPYWIHPFTVAMMHFRGNTSFLPHAIVGLLHDIPEDTNISVKMLSNLIELTEEEIEALNLLSRNKNTSYDEYIDLIANSGNKLAMTVKMSDLVHNIDLDRFIDAEIPITSVDEDRTIKYAEKIDQIYVALKKLNNKEGDLDENT